MKILERISAFVRAAEAIPRHGKCDGGGLIGGRKPGKKKKRKAQKLARRRNHR